MTIDIAWLDSTRIHFHQRMYSRQINALADALIYSLNIRSGSALVPFLAPTRASDNREAIAVWITHQLQNPDIELSRHCISGLLPRLEKRLKDIEEGRHDLHQ